MDPTVEQLIEADDRETLARWLHDRKLADVPGSVRTGWAYYAARLGKAGMLRLLAEKCHGMPLDNDANGRNLLHAAAASGDPDTMAFALHVLGMNALAGDSQGVTPLDIAARTGPGALRAMEELCGIRLADCYRNPVHRGFHPDPSVVRVGEDYYMVNSSFVMLPALPVSHSRDLVHWKNIGHVLTDPDAARLRGLRGGFGYWAPDISFWHGRFWVVATLHGTEIPVRTQMITSAPAPEGPWDAPKFLDIDGIDPSLFADDDGRRYLLTNPGAQITPVSESGDPEGEPRMIRYGWNLIKSEGPHLLKKDGWYYLFQAEGGTGFDHVETCSRSRNLYGPYESCPFNPILGKRDEESFITRSGHGKPVQLPDGRWAFVYLCGRRVEGKTLMGRETALDPLEWTADGWPMVNRLKGPSCQQKKFLPDSPAEPNEPWVCPRVSPDSFSGREKNGRIRIRGGAGLSDLYGAHALLHRLRETQLRLRAAADVRQMDTGGAAGLTGYYDENSYFFFGLRKTAAGADVILVQRIGPEEAEETLGSVPAWHAELALSGEGFAFSVSCAEAGTEKHFRAEYLADEGLKQGKRFTGALAGLAAVGTGTAFFENIREEMRDERNGTSPDSAGVHRDVRPEIPG